MRGTAALLGILLSMSGQAAFATESPKAGVAISLVKENGVWWFKDADGKKFFSLGVDCIAGCWGHSEPKPLDPAVEARTASQFATWGFNTAGAWSSPSIWKYGYVVDNIYSLFRHAESDVFDEAFWEPGFRNNVAKEISAFPDKRRLIGYCLDNELGWQAEGPYGQFAIYLKKKAGTPGSRELVAFTAKHYGNDLAKFNKDWGTKFGSFDELPGTAFPTRLSAYQWKLMNDWRTHVVDTYYRRYAGLVRELDPGRLILGVRWAGWADHDVYVASAKYFDLNTVNTYNRYGDLDGFYLKLYQDTGKPVMVTEYGFSGYPHTGKSSGLFTEVYTEANRALGYRKTVLEAARAPYMVGMHWFMWNDYAAKEGPDAWANPDRTIGLVSSDGATPYDTLTAECTRTNAEVVPVHAGSAVWKKPAAPATTHKDIPSFTPIVDGHLDEWPAACKVVPDRVRSLADAPRTGPVFYVSHDDQYVYVGARLDDVSLDFAPDDKQWQGDHLLFAITTRKDDDDEWPDDAWYVLPTGCGTAKHEPCAGIWQSKTSGEGWQAALTGGPGMYLLEARLPKNALAAFRPDADVFWRISYTDVGGIRTSVFHGDGRLAGKR